MTLLLKEADVRALLTMPWRSKQWKILRQQGNGELSLHPRRRLKLPDNALLHYMAAGDPVHGFIGMKLYTSVRGAVRFVVPLFRSATGEMAALIEADALGQIRTGAATGVATKYLANADARIAGLSARATKRGLSSKLSRPCAGSNECARLGEIPSAALNSAAR